MPNSKIHMLSGTILGGLVMIGTDLRKKTFNPIKIFVGMGISALASRLPDILEPATSPNHRGFFHSVVFFVLLALLCAWIWKKLKSVGENEEAQPITLNELLLMFLFVGLLCVILHLLFDSFTKKSLPLV